MSEGKWSAFNRWREEFVDGKQIKRGERVRVLKKSEAEELAQKTQRMGKFFKHGELMFERWNRFTPIVWKDYKDRGFLGRIAE